MVVVELVGVCLWICVCMYVLCLQERQTIVEWENIIAKKTVLKQILILTR